MKAFAYKEEYSKTPYSDKPVTYYVLRPTVLSAIRGLNGATTTSILDLKKIIEEEQKKGVCVVTSNLPIYLPKVGTLRIKEDVLTPLDRAA